MRLDQAILTALILLIVLLTPRLLVYYSDYLWFESVGYQEVFLKIIESKIAVGLAAAAALFVFLSANLFYAGLRDYKGYLLAGLLSCFFGMLYSGQWLTVLKYLEGVTFNVTDPIFNKDISFYVFTLPLLKVVKNLLFLALFISAGAVALHYFHSGAIILKEAAQEMQVDDYFQQAETGGIELGEKVYSHAYILGALFFLFMAFSHYLGLYGVLFSDKGVVYGATYTDVNVVLPATKLLILVSVAAAGAFLTRKKEYVYAGVAGYLFVSIVGLGVAPSLIQQYRVNPSEIQLEEKYIENNIEATRRAYDLHDTIEVDAKATGNFSKSLLSEGVVENIRLWDWRPLKQTYRQMQEIRSYYTFNDIDIDRYNLQEGYRQVMLSGREFDHKKLNPQSQTWVNSHLVYTHGYGLVANKVNEVSEEGLPRYIVKDIPPEASQEARSMKPERPAIYYGEKTSNYVLVDTGQDEFDYPSGDLNNYTNYKGTGGVSINSILRELVYSLRFADINILLTQYLKEDSKIMYNRNIQRRINMITPFLGLDHDPYLVSEEGRLYWMQDAYTYSNQYPYSRRLQGGFNYIRNSVKAVVDAYNGEVNLYVYDRGDPVIQTYQNIFPGLFKNKEQMPDEISRHVRYPEDLFKVQVEAYSLYHMTDPTVFYNQEDEWNIPDEVYGQGNRQPMEPYYLITKLPEKQSTEFILIQPYTPKGRDNMIAWLSAKCDENYGELVVYKYPKKSLVYGPMQIEARIDQNDQISQQLTLWSQRGSNVIRGNLIIIPLNNTLLYVEPLYIQSEQTEMPQLKRVIASVGDQLVMEDTVRDALDRLMGEKPEQKPKEPGEEEPPGEEPEKERLEDQALSHYRRAQELLKQGNYTGYGSELDNLGDVLDKLVDR